MDFADLPYAEPLAHARNRFDAAVRNGTVVDGRPFVEDGIAAQDQALVRWYPARLDSSGREELITFIEETEASAAYDYSDDVFADLIAALSE